MESDGNKEFVNDLINNLFKPKESLEELFNKKIEDLGISEASALKIMGIVSRTLKGIIKGTTKQVDFTSLIKVANFLQIPKEKAIELYVESLEKNFPIEATLSTDEIAFIRKNFDLAALRSSGFIDNITDYAHINDSINSFFGLKRITDYEKPKVEIAYSASVIVPKNEHARSFWVKTAKDIFEEIDNPFPFRRDLLISFFPQIRWHSTNIQFGLRSVINELYKMGVTVIYVPPFSSLHLRGATFSVNGKPCVVLTDLAGYYPTLWFALIHELFHVLFDWDEIQNSCYHLSDDNIDQLVVKEKEMEADSFAREYLFSKAKMINIRPFIRDVNKVKEYSNVNQVHESFVYVFYAYDYGEQDRSAWVKANKMSPKAKDCVLPFVNNWGEFKSIPKYVKDLKTKLYN